MLEGLVTSNDWMLKTEARRPSKVKKLDAEDEGPKIQDQNPNQERYHLKLKSEIKSERNCTKAGPSIWILRAHFGGWLLLTPEMAHTRNVQIPEQADAREALR